MYSLKNINTSRDIPSEMAVIAAEKSRLFEEGSKIFEDLETENGEEKSLSDAEDWLNVSEGLDVEDKSEEHVGSDLSEIEELSDAESEEILQKVKSLSLDIKLNSAKTVYQISENETYAKICSRLKIIPMSDYKKQMMSEVFDASYRALSSKSVFALVHALQMNSSVNDLRLTGNNIDSEGASHLVTLLKKNVFITNLNLSYNQVCNDGSEAISTLLKTSFYIESINLSHNKIYQDQTQLLADGIKISQSLIELDLSHNYLSKVGGTIIGQLLAENPVLKRLNLSWNDIYGSGAIRLMLGLKQNTKLEVLHLKHNRFNDDVAQSIREMLAANKTLQELDLSFNCINGKGAKLIAKSLARNNSLQIFKLAYNPLDTTSALSILKAGSKTLKELDLEDDHPLEIIRELLQDKIDIREILIWSQKSVDRESFIQLFMVKYTGW
ncbi:leucine-rich repeat-containing protein 74A-like [Centruroides sculpturatus]|uniref:leucine-rich repeat-containing protein 74A-like n=1 Tax=Centruroides sculpturatus TaxID=218467 RepID=UPI000C6E9109|nr:leucine-rich repeat-containing protein 74A-like [Centruroides sculpturatus]